MENKKHEILLGLTTTPKSDWRRKVEEIKKFGITKIALFPTFLEIEKRKELYILLDEIPGLTIPHIHLRSEDMEKWEMDWFEKKGAEKYNIHMGKIENNIFLPYSQKIYIENHIKKSIPEYELKKCAGICLDFQHWHRTKKQYPEVAKDTEKYANSLEIGCCHISALPKFKNSFHRLIKGLGGHYMVSLDEINYLKEYKKYLPKYMSIELENSFEEQLGVKKYLEEILNI